MNEKRVVPCSAPTILPHPPNLSLPQSSPIGVTCPSSPGSGLILLPPLQCLFFLLWTQEASREEINCLPLLLFSAMQSPALKWSEKQRYLQQELQGKLKENSVPQGFQRQRASPAALTAGMLGWAWVLQGHSSTSLSEERHSKVCNNNVKPSVQSSSSRHKNA